MRAQAATLARKDEELKSLQEAKDAAQRSAHDARLAGKARVQELEGAHAAALARAQQAAEEAKTEAAAHAQRLRESASQTLRDADARHAQQRGEWDEERKQLLQQRLQLETQLTEQLWKTREQHGRELAEERQRLQSAASAAQLQHHAQLQQQQIFHAQQLAQLERHAQQLEARLEREIAALREQVEAQRAARRAEQEEARASLDALHASLRTHEAAIDSLTAEAGEKERALGDARRAVAAHADRLDAAQRELKERIAERDSQV